MEEFLRAQTLPTTTLDKALAIALDAWTTGFLTLSSDAKDDPPSAEEVAKRRVEQLAVASIEAAVLERSSTLPAAWRSLKDADIREKLENQ